MTTKFNFTPKENCLVNTLELKSCRARRGDRTFLFSEERFKTMNDEGSTSLSIPQTVVKALSDKTYEKRKQGAHEIEKMVRERSSGVEEFVVTLINILTMDFTCSIQQSQRKGGLIALAAVAVGLGPLETPKHLQYLLPAIFKCFDDPEEFVRYYACESLYNIAKIARKHILGYFRAFFEGLGKLYADVHVDVKHGAQLLDKLVKDIVSENAESFQVETFIVLLEKNLKILNPYTRQFLLGWIQALEEMPGIDLLEYLPRYLDGVFSMLGDGNRQIRQDADSALGRLLAGIKLANIDIFVEKDLLHVLVIVITQSSSAHKLTRITALAWLHQFIHQFQAKLSPIYSGILGVLIRCLSDNEPDIKAVAETTHEVLLNLVRSSNVEFPLQPMLGVISQQLVTSVDMGNKKGAVPIASRFAALRWISMLLDKLAQDMTEYVEHLTPVILAALSDPSDELVLQDLEVLGRIARNTNKLDTVMHQVLRLFREDKQLFDSRGSFIIRKMCVLLEPESLYLILAKEIEKEKDLDFAHVMVQNLNLILLTAPEFLSFRNSLKNSWKESCGLPCKGATCSAARLFPTLYQTWCFDPVATLCLCLLAEAYDLSSMIVSKLSEVKITVGFLMEIDKLVQLLESPAFLHLRLELVGTKTVFRASLLRTLYGLLMILPQSQAYETLSKRLNAASAMHLAIFANSESLAVSKGKQSKGLFSKKNDLDETAVVEVATTKSILEAELTEIFAAVQHKVVDAMETTVRSKSLLNKS